VEETGEHFALALGQRRHELSLIVSRRSHHAGAKRAPALAETDHATPPVGRVDALSHEPASLEPRDYRDHVPLIDGDEVGEPATPERAVVAQHDDRGVLALGEAVRGQEARPPALDQRAQTGQQKPSPTLERRTLRGSHEKSLAVERLVIDIFNVYRRQA
jgi:hypothetical protein